MPVMVKDEARAFALNSFLSYLSKQDLTVQRDSGVASALNIKVTSRVMSSAIHTALKHGLVRRYRDAEAHDFYDNPVKFTITPRGREQLSAMS